jgi:hypothetical protein
MSYAVLARRIAYGAMGDVQATVTANVQANPLKDQARTAAVAQGIPAAAFDAIDSLTYGADPGTVLANLQKPEALKSGALKLIQSVSSQQIYEVTGVPVEAVDIAKGVVAGNLDPVATAQAVGGAVGTAVCGPACGAVVGTVAGAVAGGIKYQLDEPARQQAIADKMAALAAASEDLNAVYHALESEMDVAMRFGVATVYKSALNLKIVVQYPLASGGTTTDADTAKRSVLGLLESEESYAQEHGQSVSQAVLLEPRKRFIEQVSSAVNSKYGGMWNRDQAESGYTTVLGYMMPLGPVMVPFTNDDGSVEMIGPMYSFPVGAPNLLFHCNPDDLGYPKPGPDDISENPRTAPWAIPVFRCKCQKHAIYFSNVIQNAAKDWGRIASRSVAMWQLQDGIAKQKALAAALNAATNTAVSQVKNLAQQTLLKLAAAQQQQTMTNLLVAQTAQRQAFAGKRISKTALALLIGGAGIATALWYWFEESKPAAASAG